MHQNIPIAQGDADAGGASPADHLQRAAATADIVIRLHSCLAALDELDHLIAAAYVDQAIHNLQSKS